MSTNPTAPDREGTPAAGDRPDDGEGGDPPEGVDGSTTDDRTVVECLGARMTVQAGGTLTNVALRRAEQVARSLDRSVRRHSAALAASGRVESVHLARLLERASEYHRRTDGAFDVRDREGTVRAWIGGDSGWRPGFDRRLPDGETGVAVADVPVTFGDLALGYAVDRVAATLDRSDRPGRVDAGRVASSPGGIEVRPPGGESFGRIVGDWSVATTGTPRGGEAFDLEDGDVVVLARRDCTEAVALCSILEAGSEALRIASEWDGGAALLVQGGVVRTGGGFDAHLE